MNTSFPSILDDLKKLEKLKELSKLDLDDIFRDISTMNKNINLIQSVSSQKPCCDEDM